MSILNAIILGLVQGVAEFLPISSSGHLAVLQNMLGMSDMGNDMFFDVLLHLGTLFAICYVYWEELAQMAREVSIRTRGGTHIVVNGKRRPLLKERMFVLICISIIPMFLILPIHDYVDALASNTLFVGLMLVLTGFILLVADKMEQGTKTERNSTAKDALFIGLCQCIAVLPGLSRSGVTITAGMASGHRREYAVKFSLLMSIPAVLGATLLELIKAIKVGIDVAQVPAYIIGMVVAMVSGVFAIRLIKRIAHRGNFGGFAYYCWVIGVLAIILTFIV